jgi:hypothetical protein
MSSVDLVSTIVDDRDPAIHYLPNAEAWSICTHAEESWRLYNNSDTFSKSQGAYILYTFDGDVSWFLSWFSHSMIDIFRRPLNIGVIKARTMALALLILVSSTSLPSAHC